MDTKTIVMCVFALILGMLLVNMLKNVCGCKTVEGVDEIPECDAQVNQRNFRYNTKCSFGNKECPLFTFTAEQVVRQTVKDGGDPEEANGEPLDCVTKLNKNNLPNCCVKDKDFTPCCYPK